MPGSTTSTSSHGIKGAIQSLSRHAKEHNASVQRAYMAYYGGGITPTSSAHTTPSHSARPSIESAERPASHKNNSHSSWSKFKKQLKEHHVSVTNAYTSYYGSVPRMS